MQARSVWTPPGGALGRLCAHARQRSQALMGGEALLRARAVRAAATPSMVQALRSGPTVAVIAEVKRRSPSKGSLDDSIDAPSRARAYQSGGAAAISVLTEPSEFGGSIEDLVAVREAVGIPVLRKDFHVDQIQLLEARAVGASAVLLIARALGPDLLLELADACREIAIEALIEVRDEAELSWALESGAEMIGVNRRDLETLEMDDDLPARILPLIPPGVIAISESGVSSRADVEEAASTGADAVLVGSTLSLAADPEIAVRGIAGVARRPRTGS